MDRLIAVRPRVGVDEARVLPLVMLRLRSGPGRRLRRRLRGEDWTLRSARVLTVAWAAGAKRVMSD